MRDKLKALPFVCRSSFVKMHMLKMSTNQLICDTSSKLVHNNRAGVASAMGRARK
jgi:hypothetical protein